jgi:hypothetical protein
MRATVVKRLRRQIYGKGTHPGLVEHFTADCHARRDYQALKRAYRQGARP